MIRRKRMPPIRSITVIAAVACTFVIFLTIWSFSSSEPPPPKKADAPPRPFTPPYGSSPISTSWKGWFHPGAWSEGRNEAQKGGKVDKEWNIYYHLGGNGPWVPKTDGIVTNDTAPPQGCTVQQVHMLSRHAERYPTQGSGQRMIDVLSKMKGSTSDKIEGDLAFLNHWTMFFDDPVNQLEQLTKTGPYAGSLESFSTGVKFRTRYNHLINRVESSSSPLKIWSASGTRVQATATYFSLGLFGLSANKSSQLVVIPEDPSTGANTLTPAENCIAYTSDPKNGHDLGDTMMTKFRATYLKPVATRIRKQLALGRHVKVDFTDDEIYSMQEICGFETIARGKSPWCDVFTKEEWEAFEYARDVLHYYRTGPGNPWGSVLGSLWLNATGQLLAKGGLNTDPVSDPFYLTFTHDTALVSILSTLGILRDGPNTKLPITKIEQTRSWKMSQTAPMGARFVFERLVCSDGSSNDSKDVYVRLNINDGIIAIPGCAQGPGLSCPLKGFLGMLDEKLHEAGSFAQKCGLTEDLPKHIDFLHQ